MTISRIATTRGGLDLTSDAFSARTAVSTLCSVVNSSGFSDNHVQDRSLLHLRPKQRGWRARTNIHLLDVALVDQKVNVHGVSDVLSVFSKMRVKESVKHVMPGSGAGIRECH